MLEHFQQVFQKFTFDGKYRQKKIFLCMSLLALGFKNFFSSRMLECKRVI